MARVEISLNGRPYAVACEDGQEQRLREIAAYVDAKMNALSVAKPTAAETQIMVLALLTMADQIFDLRSELAKSRTGGTGADTAVEERFAMAIENLAKRVNTVAKKLATT